MKNRVVVIGGGPAGLMAAIAAAGSPESRDVLILERSGRLGGKLPVTGGGKCNLVNESPAPEDFVTAAPRFHLSALARFSSAEVLAFFGARGVIFEPRAKGRIFCENGAAAVIAALEREARGLGVRISTGSEVKSVIPGQPFRITASTGEVLADRVVVATGGPAWPQAGGNDFGLALAARLGLPVEPFRPALAPLVIEGPDAAWTAELSGVSAVATVRVPGASATEEVLFTHFGLSGPAIMDVSTYWRPGETVEIDFFRPTGRTLDERMADKAASRMLPETLLSETLPKRLAAALARRAEAAGLACKPLSAFSAKERDRAAGLLSPLILRPASTAGWKRAEASLGGVSGRALSSKTLECAAIPGLHFAGEAVDVCGRLGGFNLHWAWASGRAAGMAAGKS